jgi:hypothetical protein
MKNIVRLIIFIFCFSVIRPIYAVGSYNKDLSLEPNSVNTVADILVGKTVRIYATVTNNSNQDLFGVVKFYDENKKSFVGEDQPVSVLAQKTDDVFIDWKGESVGNYPISIRVIPWNEEGDDPSNNKVTKVIYVDIDSDGDGIGNFADPDDDNDGAPDNKDAFPLNSAESLDTDGDGIGNNADEDDDNDGISDIVDLFPLDIGESKDRDNDGVGDNTDAFPDDPNETKDSDNDGLGDNSDPNNANHGPVPQIETEKNIVSKGKVITFNALNSRDPDGEIVDYKWNFGDGTEETGIVIDHIFEKTGDYNITLKVTDDKGEPREQIINIKVVPKWQTIAIITVTLLLVLLVIGRWLITSGDKKPKMPDVEKTVVKKKKALPKRKK